MSLHAANSPARRERFGGGRSGPSAANVSTLGTTAENSVGVEAGAGTASTEFRIAPIEQHEAQAQHLFVLASMTLADVTELAEPDESSSAWAAWSRCS